MPLLSGVHWWMKNGWPGCFLGSVLCFLQCFDTIDKLYKHFSCSTYAQMMPVGIIASLFSYREWLTYSQSCGCCSGEVLLFLGHLSRLGSLLGVCCMHTTILTAIFQVNLGWQVPPWFSSSTCFESEPSGMSAIGCWPDCKPEGPLFSAEFVCLSVSDRHFYPSALTDFDETWSQGPYSDLVWPWPYWSRLAAEGPRNAFLKISKILKNHRIRISKFWSIFCVCVSCIVKKFDSIQTKLT